MIHETFDVFEALGLYPDELKWQDLAMCKNQPIKLFHEDYESDTRTAKMVDAMCLSCPVRATCLRSGVENGEWGVWGGVFLIAGRADEAKNSHKTEEVWEQIREDM